MRKISDEFKEDLLKKENLHSLLKYVQEDDTLDLELRGDYISIYYRGAPLMNIKETDEKDENDKNIYKWDSLSSQYNDSNIPIPTLSKDNIELYIPICKHIIDRHIVCSQKNILGEREIEQLVVKENNYSPNSNDTDYFIVDMEYKDTAGEFDLVALKWDASPQARKSNKVSLTIIEVKQGINSICTKSKSPGLKQHQEDFNKFIENPSRKKEFIDDMLIVFKQKCELGLIKGNSKIKNLKEDSELVLVGDLDFACLLANYKTASDNLKKELAEMKDCQFFTSSFMGYGLYSNNIIDKKEILNIIVQKNN